MLLIPTIDLRGGKCVCAGKMHTHGKAVPADDPLGVARRWVEAGARRLHVTDLDSMTSGKPVNAGVIRAMAAACPGVPVQVSGGLRSDAAVESYFAAGVSFVVLGMKVTSTPHFVNNLCLEYPGHVIVALDSRAGKAAAEGWSKFSNHDVIEVAQHFQREGAAAILYNEVDTDGKPNGRDVKAVLALAQAVTIPVIAGGVRSLVDLEKLCLAGGDGLGGAVLKDGLYDGALDFVKAQQLTDSLVNPA